MIKGSPSPNIVREPVEAKFRCLSGEKYCLTHHVSQAALIPAANFCLGSVAVSRASEEEACAVFCGLWAEIQPLLPCGAVPYTAIELPILNPV